MSLLTFQYGPTAGPPAILPLLLRHADGGRFPVGQILNIGGVSLGGGARVSPLIAVGGSVGSWVGGLTPVELDVESVGPSRQSLQNFRCLKLPHPGLLPVSWTPCYGVYVAAISLGRPVRQSQLQRNRPLGSNPLVPLQVKPTAHAHWH